MQDINTICYNASKKSFEYKSTRRAMGPHDVFIRTTHSGLCTTDVHAKEKGCGLGHEGVGVVEEIGAEVRNLSIGQTVGWGWLHKVRNASRSFPRNHHSILIMP